MPETVTFPNPPLPGTIKVNGVHSDAGPGPIVGPGDMISVTVAGGPGDVDDWVGLSTDPPEGPDSHAEGWTYLNGSQTTPPIPGLKNATLTFTAPTIPGLYKATFWAHNTYDYIDDSDFTVSGTAPPPPPPPPPVDVPTALADIKAAISQLGAAIKALGG